MIKGILFDLDGTLADTIEDLTDSMNYALTQLGCPTLSIEQCRQMVGSGLKNFASQALPADRQELHPQLMDLMVSRYAEICLDKTMAFAGMNSTLVRLRAQNIQLGVLTNKNQEPAEKIVHHLFGKELFDPIVGLASGRKVKPDPQTTWGIIEHWGLHKDSVLYVGDSDVDVRTAIAAQVRCAACLWGYRSQEQLEAAGATVFIRHPEELLALLQA
ncbi:MAG: HAD family hydrolase [Planctomycetaceae bacterium]|nr:HAD family hydrolase [Planctomycetaceae bacterium]